tara:strand:+ start:1635 stop:1925 length:291 start_codon:yes stop_codon:yes gene_type:complete
MTISQNTEEFYRKFLKKLKISHSWPGKYMFKFIMPSNSLHIEELISIFEGIDVNISRKYSANKKFLSISFNTYLDFPEEVVKLYKKTSHFEGLIRL